MACGWRFTRHRDYVANPRDASDKRTGPTIGLPATSARGWRPWGCQGRRAAGHADTGGWGKGCHCEAADDGDASHLGLQDRWRAEKGRRRRWAAAGE